MVHLDPGFPMQRRSIVSALAALLLSHMCTAAVPDIFRSWFTPTVVPNTFTGNVRFEAEITGGPVSVAFRYNSVDRPMFDDGSNGDLAAGDVLPTNRGTYGVQSRFSDYPPAQCG